MISFIIDEVRFNFRVAGVCIDQGRVLLQQFAGTDSWCLPGGRVEAGEPTAVAVQREWQEELHEIVAIRRLLWVVENFYQTERANHELGLYYEVDLPADSAYSDKTHIYAGEDSGTAFVLRWFPLASLADVVLYPPFLRTRLGTLPAALEHIIDERG